MTSNQIALAEARETGRHNREVESLQSESNKLQRWKNIVDTVGTAVGAISSIGSLSTNVVSTVLQNKKINTDKAIAEANLALRAKEISNKWNIDLIHESNIATANANTMALGLQRNFIDLGNLNENIRKNKASETLQATKIGNDYDLGLQNLAVETKRAITTKYLGELDNLNNLEKLNLQRQQLELDQQKLDYDYTKLAQDKEIAEEQMKTSKKTAKISAGARKIGALIGAAATVLRIVTGL